MLIEVIGIFLATEACFLLKVIVIRYVYYKTHRHLDLFAPKRCMYMYMDNINVDVHVHG